VSPDGKTLYVQTWTKGGLYAYDVQTGERKWRAKLKHVNHVVALRDSVVCSIQYEGLRRIDCGTGEVLERYMCGESSLFPLKDDIAFLGPYRNKWHLMRLADFSVVESFHDKLLNPRQCNLLHPAWGCNRRRQNGFDRMGGVIGNLF
jgi:hypothetical protein